MSDIQTWRYSFPSEKGEGWAIIFMDSIGCFSALSDWGNVSYRWPQQGWGPGDFRKFILGCDNYYLTEKFGQGRREYDPEGTKKSVLQHIEQMMNDGVWSIAEVEDEHALLREHSDLDSPEDFSKWLQETEIPEPYFLSCQRYVRDVTGFVEKVMPRLRKKLEEELSLTIPSPAGSSEQARAT